jgi:hypothetical protein
MVVHFDLGDGRRLGTNLIQDAVVSWEGGRTRDILSVLRGELGTCIAGTEDGRAQLCGRDAA